MSDEIQNPNQNSVLIPDDSCNVNKCNEESESQFIDRSEGPIKACTNTNKSVNKGTWYTETYSGGGHIGTTRRYFKGKSVSYSVKTDDYRVVIPVMGVLSLPFIGAGCSIMFAGYNEDSVGFMIVGAVFIIAVFLFIARFIVRHRQHWKEQRKYIKAKKSRH